MIIDYLLLVAGFTKAVIFISSVPFSVLVFTVMVLDIDESRRRISLGLKQCNSNPWDAFAAKYNKNDKHSFL